MFLPPKLFDKLPLNGRAGLFGSGGSEYDDQSGHKVGAAVAAVDLHFVIHRQRLQIGGRAVGGEETGAGHVDRNGGSVGLLDHQGFFLDAGDQNGTGEHAAGAAALVHPDGEHRIAADHQGDLIIRLEGVKGDGRIVLRDAHPVAHRFHLTE